jgi:hypothetical protein
MSLLNVLDEQQPALPELFTMAEVARALKINKRTLRRWIIGGEFPDATHRINRKTIRWSASTVAEAVKRQSSQKPKQLARSTYSV